MRKTAPQIRQDLAAISDEANGIIRATSGRQLSAVESERVNALTEKFTALTAELSALEMVATLGSPMPRITAPGLPQADNAERNGGWRNPGQFFSAVRAAAQGRVDPRLVQNAQTTFGNEGAGADGGFSIPPDWRRQILELLTGPKSIVSLFNPIPTPSNQVILPVDEVAAHSTAGISAAWTNEGAAITPSKPVLKQVTINLHKVAGLVHLSDELVEDNPVTGAYALTILAKKVLAVVEESIVAGDGSAKPLGLLNAPGLVTQTKATTGTAITAKDLGNMVARMVPGSFGNSFWLLHTSVLPYVWNLTVGQSPVMVADYTKSPYGTILGRPVFTSEFCKDYNTVGDIFLVSPDGYGLAVKSQGMVVADTSMHFAFDQNLQSFRVTMRVGGTPLLSGAVERKNGSDTLSHIVALGVRS